MSPCSELENLPVQKYQIQQLELGLMFTLVTALMLSSLVLHSFWTPLAPFCAPGEADLALCPPRWSRLPAASHCALGEGHAHKHMDPQKVCSEHCESLKICWIKHSIQNFKQPDMLIKSLCFHRSRIFRIPAPCC